MTALGSHLALCHLLLAGAALCGLKRRRREAAYLLCLVGYGGLACCWSRHTDLGGHWLELGGVRHRADRRTLATSLVHAPALAAGLYLLLRHDPVKECATR